MRKVIDVTDLDGLRLAPALRQAPVLGAPQLLQTMTANLIDNAVRHNTPVSVVLPQRSNGIDQALPRRDTPTCARGRIASAPIPADLFAFRRYPDGYRVELIERTT